MTTFHKWINTAEAIPLNRVHNGGNEMQVCEYKTPFGLGICERTFIPWSFLKPITTLYVPDIIYTDQDRQRIESNGGTLTDCYYTDPGYYMAEFKDMEQAFNEIIRFKMDAGNV